MQPNYRLSLAPASILKRACDTPRLRSVIDRRLSPCCSGSPSLLAVLEQIGEVHAKKHSLLF